MVVRVRVRARARDRVTEKEMPSLMAISDICAKSAPTARGTRPGSYLGVGLGLGLGFRV